MKAEILIILDALHLMLNLIIMFTAAYIAFRNKLNTSKSNITMVISVLWLLWVGSAVWQDAVLYHSGAFDHLNGMMNWFIARKALLIVVNTLWGMDVMGYKFGRLRFNWIRK